MREHRYTLVFMLDSAALITTKFMMPAAYAIPDVGEHFHEWALLHDSRAGFRPGHEGDDDRERKDVEQEQPSSMVRSAAGMAVLRILGLARGHGNDLDAVE